MTTEIIVKAHCGSDKQVEITIHDFDNRENDELHILQDGEEKEMMYVYDSRMISVMETEKS